MKPRVLLVGGQDVDARIELIQQLKEDFCFSAAGTEAQPGSAFQKVGVDYYKYTMARRVDPLADVHMVVSLARLYRRIRPHIIHSFDTKPCVFARLAGRISGVPVVLGTLPGLGSLYAENGVSVSLTRLIYENLQRIASRASDLTVFQNRQDAEQFIAHGTVPSTKSTVIPGSGVRTDLFDPEAFTPSDRKRVRAELGIKQDDLLVTMVSRIIRSKGVNEFADAAQIVTSRNPRIDFLLVGPRDDDSRDRLLPEEVEQLGRSVKWVGPRADIPTILAATDVFVLPSFYREGIPRVLLEAASMGLPIITTDSPGCNDVVEHGLNGLLVPMKDSKALAEAIQCLLDNADIRHRFGRESRQRAVSRFGLAMIANQTRSLYIDLLSHKGVAVAAAKW